MRHLFDPFIIAFNLEVNNALLLMSSTSPPVEDLLEPLEKAASQLGISQKPPNYQ